MHKLRGWEVVTNCEPTLKSWNTASLIQYSCEKSYKILKQLTYLNTTLPLALLAVDCNGVVESLTLHCWIKQIFFRCIMIPHSFYAFVHISSFYIKLWYLRSPFLRQVKCCSSSRLRWRHFPDYSLLRLLFVCVCVCVFGLNVTFGLACSEWPLRNWETQKRGVFVLVKKTNGLSAQY